MSKPILYQFAYSPAVRSVRMIASEIGVDLELRDINILKGEQMSESYLKMNPQHTVPTLDDDGLFIWDSHAIGIYLIEKYANDSPLYPNDPYIRARINQRLHFDTGVLFGKLATLLIPVFRGGASTLNPDHIEGVKQAYEMLNTFLNDDPYLVGDSITFADIACISTVSSMDQVVPIDPEKYSNIIDWMNRMAELPYYDELNGQVAIKHGEFLRQAIARNQPE